MSVLVRPKLSADEMLAVLPYRLGDLGGFHLLRVAPNGTAALTLVPTDTPLPVEQPYFLVVWQSVRPPAAEYEAFARRAFAEFSNGGSRIVSSEAKAGSAASRAIRSSRKGRTSAPATHSSRCSGMSFVDGVVQGWVGIARKDQWDTVLPRMRAIRDGFGVK